MTAEPVVYRVYDADDRLIYIGATSNLTQRLIYHRSQAWWWGLPRLARFEAKPGTPHASAVGHRTWPCTR